MRFLPDPSRTEGTPPRLPGCAVLLCNLGTPDAADAPALRRYLAEFLADPRVVEIPRWLWWPILHGVVLRT
ncbi:MAG TPA: ferrochelatase, partial [Burkholderiaceae bacterium]|nr:ferrochelatase [Burkholderiaceae bacterium]